MTALDQTATPTTRNPRKLCTVVSVFLSLVLLLQTPTMAMASTVTAVENGYVSAQSVGTDTYSTDNIYGGAVDIKNIPNDKIVGELIGKREEYIKYFRLVDGTILSATYEEPVHIKDSNGAWQELDYSLSDDGTDLGNSSGSMRVKFSKNPKNGKLYMLQTEHGQIKWNLPGIKENAKEAKLTQKATKTHKLEVRNVSGCVSYEDVRV